MVIRVHAAGVGGARVLGVATTGGAVVLVAGLVGGGPSEVLAPGPPGPRPGVLTAASGHDGWAVVPYRSPVAGRPTIARPFAPPAQQWSAGHRGVDLSLAPGGAVLAAGRGVVVFAGPVVDRPVVSVQHPDGVRTTYEPVTTVVAPGQEVAAGQVLGYLAGPGHCPPDGCLHWGARRGAADYLDPMSLLQTPVVRLLPG